MDLVTVLISVFCLPWQCVHVLMWALVQAARHQPFGTADASAEPILQGGTTHMPAGSSKKRERQYEHIKDSYKDRGVSTDEAEERAARTVNKQRRKSGETKKK
jgi:hypothetical protein